MFASMKDIGFVILVNHGLPAPLTQRAFAESSNFFALPYDRGELPKGFWTPDEQGLVCAVDMSFMSTSRARQTPVDYMGEGSNVLWALQPMRETDVGYHRGADVSMLSQFEAEKEILFPPATMLEVKKLDMLRRGGEKVQTNECGKVFMEIEVLPTFV